MRIDLSISDGDLQERIENLQYRLRERDNFPAMAEPTVNKYPEPEPAKLKTNARYGRRAQRKLSKNPAAVRARKARAAKAKA